MNLSEDMAQCRRCGLHRQRHHVVVGRGSQYADVMITGEAPGKQEDQTGMGFQGSAGKIFDEMLRYLGLARDSIWLNNAVRCRPTNDGKKNRPPTQDEILTCRPWLTDDLQRVNPRVIITLGQTAFYSITGQAPLSQFRGQLWPHHSPPVYPLFHPAYLIYKQSALHDYARDLQRLRRILLEMDIALADSLPSRFSPDSVAE